MAVAAYCCRPYSSESDAPSIGPHTRLRSSRPNAYVTLAPQRYMRLHQAYLVTCLEGKDAWKHPTNFSLGMGAAVDDVGFKEYDLRYSHLRNTCLPCKVTLHAPLFAPLGRLCMDLCCSTGARPT